MLAVQDAVHVRQDWPGLGEEEPPADVCGGEEHVAKPQAAGIRRPGGDAHGDPKQRTIAHAVRDDVDLLRASVPRP